MRWREGKLLRIINNYSSKHAWSIVRSDLRGFQPLFQSSSAKPFASLLRIKAPETNHGKLTKTSVHSSCPSFTAESLVLLSAFLLFFLAKTEFCCRQIFGALSMVRSELLRKLLQWLTRRLLQVQRSTDALSCLCPLASTIAGPHSTAAGRRTKPAVTFLGERWPHVALWAEACYEGVPQRFQASYHTSLFEINSSAICTCIVCCSK